MAHDRSIVKPVRCAALCLVLLVSGCTERGSITLDPDAATTGSVHNILVASTRAPDPGALVLSRDRSDTVRFLDFAVAVPPDRVEGTVTFPRGTAIDPTRDFVTVSGTHLNGIGAFRAAVDARAAALPAARREALVFVHGYNTNFAEGLYRQAQIAHDFQTRGVSVNYAWSSAGDFRAYAFDRESALFARDGLETTLDALARSSVSNVVVVGHSMGAQVLMDTLRQMAIRGAPAFFAKLSSVVLIAPDLDIDVFRTQAALLAGKDVPVYVFVSNRDRALQLSSLLRGRAERLGSIRNVGRLESLSEIVPIRVIDLTDFDANGDPLLHFKAVTSPMMIALFDGLGSAGLEMFRDAEARPGLLQAGLLATQDATNLVLGRDTQP